MMKDIKSSMKQTNKDKMNLKDQVYLTLKENLINCIYEPGSILNEAKLASEFGLSRTPIREAIGRLEMDGYVQVIPKKGIYVTEVSMNTAMQIFQTRIEIEPITLKMAAPYLNINDLIMFKNQFEKDDLDIKNAFRLDTAMHLYIIEHCQNAYLIEMMQKLFNDNTRVVISTKQNQTKIHDAKCEHLKILDSLINGKDIDQTALLMREHIKTCKRAAIDFFYSYEYVQNEQISKSYKQELSYITTINY